MSVFYQVGQGVRHAKEEAADVTIDFVQTATRIANLPCHDSSSEEVLRELCRWNNPGKSFAHSTSRFVATSLPLPRPSWSNNPTIILFRAIKAMTSGSDRVPVKKPHWKEVEVDLRWCSNPTTRLLGEERPLYKCLKRSRVGNERTKVGLSATYDFFMHSAVHDTVNRIIAASAESATLSEVEYFIGRSNILRPLPQHLLDWRSLATPTARRVAVWTLAASCSMWGLDFVQSFLEFCTATLVGPICGVTRDECKEGFAACVAVATIARARPRSPITNQEIACCARALWVLEVIERACGAAQGTLWSSRYITKATGARVQVKACNKWASPIHDDLQPSNLLFVTGTDCAHSQKENLDGTYGGACEGRWIVVTKLEQLEQLQTQDPKMMVTLTHMNVAATNNVLALLERRGQWAYVQGKQECLTCAYKRALRHGFPVIVD